MADQFTKDAIAIIRRGLEEDLARGDTANAEFSEKWLEGAAAGVLSPGQGGSGRSGRRGR